MAIKDTIGAFCEIWVWPEDKIVVLGVSIVAQWVMNLTGVPEEAGSIPGLHPVLP